jgi:hypothetical protein
MDIKPKFIEADGVELVVLTRSEFEALIDAVSEADEMAEDVAIYDQRKASLDRGESSILPTEVSARILKGESVLKAVRNWRGKTQVELSSATSIGQGYLSDLESGRRIGTPDTLRAIAGELDVPVSWLINEP